MSKQLNCFVLQSCLENVSIHIADLSKNYMVRNEQVLFGFNNNVTSYLSFIIS